MRADFRIFLPFCVAHARRALVLLWRCSGKGLPEGRREERTGRRGKRDGKEGIRELESV